MSLFIELKRRNVFRVGIAYLIVAWLVMQVADVVLNNIAAPDWVFRVILLVLGIGFPLILLFAWAFELTPEGLKREKDVDRSHSIAPATGRRLDRAIIAVLVIAVAYFAWESRFANESPGQEADLDAAARANPNREAVGEPAAVAPPAVTADNAIAVLPFANRSMKEEDLFFTDGIHDDLLTQLAKIEGLKVISRTSVMEYRDTTRKISQIAAELGVSKILEGGVQRAGDRVRINAQLIDVATDQHLWAETFDREMTIDNIFDIQSEITRRIVTAVKGELSAADQRTLGSRPTNSLDAWEAWLVAENIIAETDYSEDKYRRATPWALKAVEADPNFADAWVTLADIQMQSIWIGYENTGAQREAVRDSLARAENLAADSPAVKSARAAYHYRIDLDYERCLALLEEARTLAPGDVQIHRDLGLALRRLGRWEESVRAFEKTLELDPLNSFAAATLAETLSIMNDFERLEPLLDRWLVLDPNSGDLVSWQARMFMEHYGDIDAAEEILDSAPLASGPRYAQARRQVARLRRDWDRLVALNHEVTTGGPIQVMDRTLPYRLGWIHSMKGEPETARIHFGRYIDEARADEFEGRVARAFRTINLAQAHAWLGNADAALALADLASTLMPADADHVFGSLIHNQATWLLAYSGQRDLALDRIAAQLEQPEGFTRWELYLDPAWDFFRDDPRFNDLVRPAGVEADTFLDQRVGSGP